jgi:hypothetical protein
LIVDLGAKAIQKGAEGKIAVVSQGGVEQNLAAPLGARGEKLQKPVSAVIGLDVGEACGAYGFPELRPNGKSAEPRPLADAGIA